MKKVNSIFYYISHIRSLLFGLSGLLIVLYSINNLNQHLEDFPVTKGEIFFSNLRWDDKPFDIKLENKNGLVWYSVYHRSKYFPILQEKAIKGKQATIWYNPEDRSIEQLVVEDELIVPYDKSVGVHVFFIIVGLACFVGTIVYFYKIISNKEESKSRAASASSIRSSFLSQPIEVNRVFGSYELVEVNKKLKYLQLNKDNTYLYTAYNLDQIVYKEKGLWEYTKANPQADFNLIYTIDEDKKHKSKFYACEHQEHIIIGRMLTEDQETSSFREWFKRVE